jgi:hypothetical protein
VRLIKNLKKLSYRNKENKSQKMNRKKEPPGCVCIMTSYACYPGPEESRSAFRRLKGNGELAISA